MLHPLSNFDVQFFRSPDKHILIPLLSCYAAAGFPSPADDHLDNSLDIVDLLIRRPASTFFVRAKGRSMQGVGVFDNDILVVDRSVTPVDNSMVVAAINGDCLVKLFRRKNGRCWLQSANKEFSDLPLDETTDFQVWGVVTSIIRQHGENGHVCIG